MPHNVDREGVEEAYERVRSDTSKETWALFGYSDTSERIVPVKSGEHYQDFQDQFKDDERLYGFVRIQTGDEMSRRSKFVFITWIGENVPPLKKAKVSTDKGNVKHYITNFALEVLTSEKSDLDYERLQSEVDKVGGAHYGTGK